MNARLRLRFLASLPVGCDQARISLRGDCSVEPQAACFRICARGDVRRAAGIRNVGFCKLKLKLKRFRGLAI